MSFETDSKESKSCIVPSTNIRIAKRGVLFRIFFPFRIRYITFTSVSQSLGCNAAGMCWNYETCEGDRRCEK